MSPSNMTPWFVLWHDWVLYGFLWCPVSCEVLSVFWFKWHIQLHLQISSITLKPVLRLLSLSYQEKGGELRVNFHICLLHRMVDRHPLPFVSLLWCCNTWEITKEFTLEHYVDMSSSISPIYCIIKTKRQKSEDDDPPSVMETSIQV